MNSSPLSVLPPTFGATVEALHRVAEQLVAPARKPDNEIALAATPGGFGTPQFEFAGARRQVRVEGAELVQLVGAEERRAPLTSLARAGEAIADLLPAGSALDSEPLAVDAEASQALGAWYSFGADVLCHLVAMAAPEDAPTPPRLWPEHFDIAIELGPEASGGRANYGFSPGDENHSEPYLYVGPWSARVSGELWGATGFNGAELSYSELVVAPDQRSRAIEFLETRQQALREAT